MAIEPRFTDGDIRRIIEERRKRIENAIIFNLKAVGRKAVNEAVIAGSYTDQTGALRSSIGYILIANGNVVTKYGFNKGKATVSPKQQDKRAVGASTGSAFIDELAKLYKYGYVLVVVAGMEYAVKVETVYNKNVLASSEILARQLADEVISKLKNKLNK